MYKHASNYTATACTSDSENLMDILFTRYKFWVWANPVPSSPCDSQRHWHSTDMHV